MTNRYRGMTRLSAAMIALLIGLTGCGTVAANNTETLMDEKLPAASETKMTEATMVKETMTAETMTKETMTTTNSSGDNTMAAEPMTKVEYEKNFNLMDLDGNSVTLEKYAGKKVYVKFWATWCSICLAGIKDLEAFAAEQNAGSDVAVITIVAPGVSGEFSTEDFKEWYKKQGYTFPVLFDEGGTILRAFGVRAFPTSVIFGKDGKISTTRIGHIDNDELKTLLSGM